MSLCRLLSLERLVLSCGRAARHFAVRTPESACRNGDATKKCVLTFVRCLLSLLIAQNAYAESPRIPWTTPYVTGSPEPPSPYTVERIFPDLRFSMPTDLILEPHTGQWLILLQDGTIQVLDPQKGEESLTTILDPASVGMPVHQAYGIELHPQFPEKPEIFLAYAATPEGDDSRKVSRFRITDAESLQIDPKSEEVLMSWFALDHNGGNLKFGPDGMLYITAGDSAHAFPPDEFNAAQNMQDVRGKLLRINVDVPSKGKLYSIPEDNPFVDMPEARGEIWTLGMRNPWKISFDSVTGELWCADVGWEMWEMVYLIEKGGNYGWPIREGRQPIRTDVTPGPGKMIAPLAEHDHSEARSITGGYVYHGDKLPELKGGYLYGDWSTGIIWSLKQKDGQVTSLEKLVDTPLAIISIGWDTQGEPIFVDYSGGLYRLIPNTQQQQQQQFPTRLSETGLFSSVADQVPSPGVIPYQLNAGLYAEGATAKHFLALPHQEALPLPFIKYPKDAVFVKTLSMPGADPDKKPVHLETQLLHFDGSEWRGYSYLWNDEQTDAELVPSEGTEKVFQLPHAEDQNIAETLTWRVDSRANCMICHGWIIGHVVGFTFPNLDRRYDPEALATALKAAGQHFSPKLAETNQIDLLKSWKVFDGNYFPQQHQGTIVNPHDESQNLEQRARSYLAVNCAHCHRREGGGTSSLELPWEVARDKMNAIDAPTMLGNFGIQNARVIASGRPDHSVLYYRMATVGRGHMPHLGTPNVDEQGLALIRDWIISLNPNIANNDASLKAESELVDEFALNEALEESHQDQRQRILESTSATLRLADRIRQLKSDEERIEIAQGFAAESPAHLRGIFERFLPDQSRQETLGTTVDPQMILALTGNVETGRNLFHVAEGLSCRTCHQAEGKGRELGPDLSSIGLLRTPEHLLESILEPSKQIDPKYVNYVVETTQGRLFSGLIVQQDQQSLILRDNQGELITIPAEDVETLIPQPLSLMPELLVKDLTAQDLADLLAYLASLKSESP